MMTETIEEENEIFTLVHSFFAEGSSLGGLMNGRQQQLLLLLLGRNVHYIVMYLILYFGTYYLVPFAHAQQSFDHVQSCPFTFQPYCVCLI